MGWWGRWVSNETDLLRDGLGQAGELVVRGQERGGNGVDLCNWTDLLGEEGVGMGRCHWG